MSDTEKYIQLQEELQTYKSVFRKAADSVLDMEVSSYPIFVIHQHSIELGIPIVEREKVKGNWSVNVSSLEEFVSKQVIQPEHIEDFKRVYKDPGLYFCLFVLSELGAQFIFMPGE